MTKAKSKTNRVRVWKFLLFATLPGLMVAGFFAFANPTHKTIIDPSLPQRTIIDPSLTGRFKDGLVLHQSFDGPYMDWALTTAEARDASGKGNHGDVVGPVPTIGQVGQALSFDGVDDLVKVPGNPSLDTPDALTVAAWIFDKGDGTIHHSINKDGLGEIPPTRIWIIRRDTDTAVNWHIWNSEGVLKMLIPPGSWAINQWFHIVCTAEVIGGNIEMKVYFNGVLKGTTSFPGTAIAVDTDVPIRIGYDAGGYKAQIIDEVRIYNRALTPEEIKEHYEAGKARLQIQ